MNNRTNIGPMTITSPAPKRAAQTPDVPPRDTTGQVPERQQLIEEALMEAKDYSDRARWCAMAAVRALAAGKHDAVLLLTAAHLDECRAEILTVAAKGGKYAEATHARIQMARHACQHGVDDFGVDVGIANIRKALGRQ